MTITDLQLECSKAATIIRRFRSQEDVRMGIPPQVLAEAKGIAVLSVFKMGFGFSGRGGSGVLFSRLPDGSWSAPVAITTGGFGIGHQIGVEVTDFVIVLNTVEAVNSVAQKRSVTLGGNLSVAVGPLGRNVEAGVAASKTLSPIYSYSMTKGLFLGASFEFSAFNTRDEVNTQWYGNGLFAKEILEGFVARPVEAEELYITLDATIGYWTPSNVGGNGEGVEPLVKSPLPSSSVSDVTSSKEAPEGTPKIADGFEIVDKKE